MRVLSKRLFRPVSIRRVRACALSPPFLAMVLALLMLPGVPAGVGADGAPLKAAGVIPEEDKGFIEITVRMCPPGFDLAANGADPDQACELAPDGIRFTLRADDASSRDRHAETGQRADGIAIFERIPSGRYELTQHVPDGVDDVIILSCEGFNTGPFYRMPLDEGPELNIPVPPHAPIRCEWLNILSSVATPDASPQATPSRGG